MNLSNHSFIQALKSYSLKTVFSKALSIVISTHVIVSYQKSGKTWIRMMLGKVLAETYRCKDIKLDLEKMTLWKRGAPKILISHAGSTIKDPKIDFRRLFRRKKIIFLIRDPRDMIVSLYHSARNREKNFTGTLSEYIRGSDYGIFRIITFMNKWREEMQKRPEDFLLVRYEDVHKDAHKELERIVHFLAIPASSETVKHAVRYGSFENMRKMEADGTIQDRRMEPIDISNVNSFKTRKGKVGSYKEEMNVEDTEYANRIIAEKLDKGFGY